MLRHLHAQDCSDWEMEEILSPKYISSRNSPFSLVLVERYSAHATALHAQDCLNWRLEKTLFFHSDYKNVFITGTSLSL